MKRITAAFAMLIAVTLVLSAVPLATPQASAAVNTWVIIHARDCPTTATGNIYTACHGSSHALQGAVFSIDGTQASSSSTGTAKATVTPNTVKLTALNAPLGFTGTSYVYCSRQPHGSPVIFSTNTTTGSVTFQLRRGDVVYCDWYFRTSPV